MTDVLENIMNGTEEESIPSTDDITVGDKPLVIAEDHEDTKEGESDTAVTTSVPSGSIPEGEDTTDSISSPTGATLIIAMDEEDKEQPEGDEVREVNDDDDESKLDLMEGERTNENGEDSNMEISEEVSSSIKVEDMYEVGGEEQNSNASLSPTPASPTSKKGPTFNKMLHNGVEGNANEENSSSSSSGENNKPLLSGLLGRKDGGTSVKKTPQQSRSFSVSDGNAIAKELEEQVGKLNTLLALKEKEWSAILRLKKHMEYALDQVKCTQRIAKVQDGVNGPMSMTDIKACMNLIVSEKDKLSLAEQQIAESIESTETENESLQTIFPFRSSLASVVSTTQSELDDASEQKEDALTASAALQKLCERKRKAMDELPKHRPIRPKIVVDVQSNSNTSAPQGQRKVYGPKGNMVNVQSIIETHRNLTGDRPKAGQKQFKKTVLQMSPDRLYLKTLEELFVIAQADKTQKEPSGTLAITPAPSVPQIASTRTLAPIKPKNGKPAGRQTIVSNNSLLISNPTPSGSGTLAKMLSPSTHASGMGSVRSINDGSTNASQKFSKVPTSDGNLSLANLLATSKVESKVNLSKIKKERIREEETSHVPSQQQADAVPICQGCNLSRAQFVCAGCANQWYCSRECQVAAWDEHSEICSG